MSTSNDEFGPDFESPADPAHASAFGKTGAPNAGIGRKADSSGDPDAGARSHEADASDAADAACAEEKGGEEEIEVIKEMIEAGNHVVDCGSNGLPTTLQRCNTDFRIKKPAIYCGEFKKGMKIFDSEGNHIGTVIESSGQTSSQKYRRLRGRQRSQ